jgi:mycofactocin precursor
MGMLDGKVAFAEMVVDDANVGLDVAPEPPGEEVLVEEDLLIEDVSIDGMCGVY